MSSRVTNGSRDLILNRRWNTPSKCAQPRRAELHASRKASIKMNSSSSVCTLCQAPNEGQVNKFSSRFHIVKSMYSSTRPEWTNACPQENSPHACLPHPMPTYRNRYCKKPWTKCKTPPKRECRSHQFNKKNGRHHAQHRCYLGWTSQRMDHLKRVAH